VVRQFAVAELARDPEADDLHRRHAEHYLALAERLGPQVRVKGRGTAFDELERELGNLRAALDTWIRLDDGERALRLAAAIEPYWTTSCHYREGVAMVDAALAAAPTAGASARGRAHLARALLLRHIGQDESDTEAYAALELTDDVGQLRRLGQFAEKKKIYVAYHTHLQGSITAFDRAFAVSKANMANVDLGHYVAAGGDPLAFLNRFHDRIASFHLKDRTTPANGQKNLRWGTGDTPLVPILKAVQKNRWRMPATIELEYDVPSGSDAVREVVKCLEFCKRALA